MGGHHFPAECESCECAQRFAERVNNSRTAHDARPRTGRRQTRQLTSGRLGQRELLRTIRQKRGFMLYRRFCILTASVLTALFFVSSRAATAQTIPSTRAGGVLRAWLPPLNHRP